MHWEMSENPACSCVFQTSTAKYTYISTYIKDVFAAISTIFTGF